MRAAGSEARSATTTALPPARLAADTASSARVRASATGEAKRASASPTDAVVAHPAPALGTRAAATRSRALARSFGLVLPARAQEQRETVAADAGGDVADANRSPQRLDDGDEEAVAGRVAVLGVHCRQPVEVECDEGEGRPPAGERGRLDRDQPVERAAVGEARERVRERQALERVLARP